MSAWAELVNADGSDEWLELCSRALEEVQEETLRRAAKKIRAKADTFGDWDFTTRRDMHEAADLIDPDVEDEEEESEL
ncbi:hypothetical protein [Streptomyces sp. EN16]|uniref:hypothetical protein n=1 Tax=Streptomyces sp. EN16 TaxID=212773 RepID=UPI000851BC3B|nr:hypothetical protein [Streptomyces sp. EN16]